MNSSPSALTLPSAETVGWAPNQRRTIYLCAGVLTISLFFLLLYLHIIWSAYTDKGPEHAPPFGDFFALWSYAKIAAQHSVADLYDMATLHDRQVGLGMLPKGVNPFPYPPTVMFLFWPLDWLPYDMAFLAWMIGSLACSCGPFGALAHAFHFASCLSRFRLPAPAISLWGKADFFRRR